MKELYIKHIAAQLQVKAWQVENCATMLEDGDTIPFISRYRKEKTGGMDDATVAEVKHWVDVFDEMETRKATILKVIDEAGALTDELRAKIEGTVSSTELEDLYLPWKPKRRTRATVAKSLGLEPLADALMSARISNPEAAAKPFVKEGVPTVEDALAGARDIIAERVSECIPVRENQRASFRQRRIIAKATKAASEDPEAAKYRSYFNWSMPIARVPAHNLLAVLRAADQGFLSIDLDTDSEKCSAKVFYDYCKAAGFPSAGCKSQVQEAVSDSFDRLLQPSISGEVIREAKAKADVESIAVFGDNLRQLLLGAPVGQKVTLALDPGFRNGCKLAVLSERGDLLCHTIIYPHPPQNEKVKALTTVQDLVDRYHVQAIAVGNGTASRESVEFLKMIDLPSDCRIWTVSEDGASIYSASEAAREEFPNEDVTVRGAVSIGRRLQDPLSELVKIDPKNLGIGQYQHDVDQTLLREKLDNTVEACVNAVGVNLNTASPWLLRYVAGIGPSLARAIVDYRSERGGFRSRSELLKVPRLGPKAYQQCAGFLRVKGAANPLDDSAVHPESYFVVDRMAADLSVSVKELVGNAELCSRIDPARYVGGEVGLPTVNDILRELAKPGLDPREAASEFSFADDVRSISDLKPGMELPGIVTNITAFGAFVDIGLHENGLIHTSQMRRKVRLHEQVRVTVLDVDLERGRIALRLI